MVLLDEFNLTGFSVKITDNCFNFIRGKIFTQVVFLDLFKTWKPTLQNTKLKNKRQAL